MNAAATATTAIPTGTWAVDHAHSKVGFSVKHMGIATVRGEFTEFDGQLVIGDDLASAKITGVVKASSVDTNQPDRDNHLRTADFFDAENNPELTYESTSIEAIDEDTFRITGNLTMHGVTNELVLSAEVGGVITDPQGNEKVGLEVTGQLDRSDYGMKFNQALGGGNMLVSDKVKLSLDISATKQS